MNGAACVFGFHAMRIKGILGGRGRAKPLRWSKITVFIAGIIRGFNGVVCLSYLLPECYNH